MKKKIINIAFLMFGILQINLYSQSMSVPLEMQLTLLPKILALNKSFTNQENNTITVGVLFSSSIRNSVSVKNIIVNEYDNKNGGKLPISVIPLDISDVVNLADEIKKYEIQAIYITPIRAYDIEKISRICRHEKVISMTSVPEYLDYGVSVGFDVINNKMKIAINLESAKEEGANFSSHVLKLAHIIN